MKILYTQAITNQFQLCFIMNNTQNHHVCIISFIILKKAIEQIKIDIFYKQLFFNFMEVQKHNLLQHFQSYPQVLKGLTTHLNVFNLTDFQQQLLSVDLQEQQNYNMLISAPSESGKLLGIILFIVKKFIDLEEQRVLIIAHSKQLSQKITTIISSMCKSMILNMFMLGNSNNHQYSARGTSILPAKCFVIASPLQVETLSKENKTKITEVVIVQSQLLLSFGYKQSLYRCIDTFENLGQQLNVIVVYCSVPGQKNADIEEFKQKYLSKRTDKQKRNKLIKIDYLPPQLLNDIKFEQSEKASMHNKIDAQAAHFYHAGQKISLPICLYVTLKFNLVNPKILIICKNLHEVYKYYLFLQRTKIPNVGIYNHQNPVNLKFYNLELWMASSIDIMISTNNLIEDLQNNIFQENIKRAKKKGKRFSSFELKNLFTVICMNLSHLKNTQEPIINETQIYDSIFQLFQAKPFIMTFIENNEQEISQLHKFVKALEHKFTIVRSKQLPIPHQQLDAFKYRINDVFSALGKNKIQLFMEMDIKKKILRSPDMKQHFENAPKQKDVLIKSINQIHKKLEQDKVTITEIVPSYLVPQCLRQAYEQHVKNWKQQNKSNKEEQNTPQYHQKINRVLKHIDLQEQQPQITDISRLKLVSARKRWKLQHGFKLKKKNFRKEKKGIFDSS